MNTINHQPSTNDYQQITLEVVQRVSKRVALGLSLAMACAAENSPHVNLRTWKQALKNNRDFAVIFQAAEASFVEVSLRRLSEHGNLSHLRWLLERSHLDSSTPGRSWLEDEDEDEDEYEDPRKQIVRGLPNRILERARAYARQQALEDAAANANASTESSKNK